MAEKADKKGGAAARRGRAREGRASTGKGRGKGSKAGLLTKTPFCWAGWFIESHRSVCWVRFWLRASQGGAGGPLGCRRQGRARASRAGRRGTRKRLKWP